MAKRNSTRRQPAKQTKSPADPLARFRKVTPTEYAAMWGRAQNYIYEFARRYDIPIDQKQIDLPVVIKGLHDLIAANARRIRIGDEPAEAEDESKRYKKLQADKLEIEIADKRRKIIWRDDFLELNQLLSSRMRRFGDQLQRQFGPDALDMFNELLDDMDKAVESMENQEPDGSDEEQDDAGKSV